LSSIDDYATIESYTFSGSAIKSIAIPRDVDFIDGSAFSHIRNISNISILIQAGHSHFILDSSFIVDSSRSKLIGFFGCDSHVMIPFNIEILCSSCFSFCKSLSSISFESSALPRIESAAFAGTKLHFVLLLESVVFIAGDAFPHSCEVTLSNIDSRQEFNEWKEARQSGSRKAFEWHGWGQP
jgi:hypothetical protein